MVRTARGFSLACLGIFTLNACVEGGLRSTRKNEEEKPAENTFVEPQPEPEDTRCKYDIKGLQLGTPCNRDKDCESGLCSWVPTAAGGVYAMCATSCLTGQAACGAGFTCKNDARNKLSCQPDKLPEYTTCKDDAACGKGSRCIKSSKQFRCFGKDADGNPIPCTAAERATKLADYLKDRDGQCGKGLPNRAPCNLDADCEGGTCVFTLGGNVGYCSSPCSDDKSCGNCMACQDEQLGDMCTKICKPQGGKKIGESCGGDDEFECEAGGFCFNHRCTVAGCAVAPDPSAMSTPCETFLDCPNYSDACHAGQCQTECAENKECDAGSGYQCNSATKKCESLFECKAPSCPGDAKCGGFSVMTIFGPMPVAACFPADMFGTVSDGDACKYDFECKNPAKCIYVDAGATKKQLCARECTDDPAACAAGTECVSFGDKSQCVPSQNLGKKKDGEKCGAHVECAGRNCAQIGDEVVCASDCSKGKGCDAGLDCVEYSTWDKAPYVAALVEDNTGAVIGEQSVLDSNGGARAQLRLIVKAKKTGPHVLTVMDATEYEPLLALFGIGQQSGGYTVKIESDKSASGVAVQLVSENTANNNVTPAQTVSAPLQLSATLAPADKDHNDIDKFTINLTANETLNLMVSGPVLEVCYDQAKVGQSAIGGKCKYDFECATGLTCDMDTYKCSKHCTSNPDCGAGQACAPVQGVRRCVPATEVASVDIGAVCAPTLDYQCKGTNPSCLSWTGTPSFCSVACNPATPSACPATMECVDIAPETAPAANNMCFNKGGLHMRGERNCAANFQCESGKCSEDAFAFLFASTVCECDPATASTCGTDTSCVDVLDDDVDQQFRCLRNSDLNLAKGAECMGNFQCASGSCVEDPTQSGGFFAVYICE